MLNKIILIGRLVADVEKFKSQQGTKIVSFRLACDEPSAGEEKSTLFIDCKCFNKTAENCAKFIHKGSLVAVNGRLHQRTYTKNDGNKGTAYEVLADGVDFLDPKEKDPKVGDVAVRVASEPTVKPVDEEDDF